MRQSKIQFILEDSLQRFDVFLEIFEIRNNLTNG